MDPYTQQMSLLLSGRHLKQRSFTATEGAHSCFLYIHSFFFMYDHPQFKFIFLLHLLGFMLVAVDVICLMYCRFKRWKDGTKLRP